MLLAGGAAATLGMHFHLDFGPDPDPNPILTTYS